MFDFEMCFFCVLCFACWKEEGFMTTWVSLETSHVVFQMCVCKPYIESLGRRVSTVNKWIWLLR